MDYTQSFTYTFSAVGRSATQINLSECQSAVATLSNANAKVELFDCEAASSDLSSAECTSLGALPDAAKAPTTGLVVPINGFARGFAGVRVTDDGTTGGTVTIACSIANKAYSGGAWSNLGRLDDTEIYMTTEGQTLRQAVDNDLLAINPAHTPTGTLPIVVWESDNTVITSGCTIDDTSGQSIACPPVNGEGQYVLLCEAADAPSGGAACTGLQAPLDVDSDAPVHALDTQGRLFQTSVRREIAWVYSSGYVCGGTCDTGDHHKFNQVWLESDTDAIDCDTATAYAKNTTNTANIGRCLIKKPGTYMYRVDLYTLMTLGSGTVVTLVADLKNVRTWGAGSTSSGKVYHNGGVAGSTDYIIQPLVPLAGTMTFSAAEVAGGGAWVEVRIVVQSAAGDTTNVINGSNFYIERLTY